MKRLILALVFSGAVVGLSQAESPSDPNVRVAPVPRPAQGQAAPGQPAPGQPPPNKAGGAVTTQQVTCNGGMGQASGNPCSCRGGKNCTDQTVTVVNGLSSNSPMHACVCAD